MRPWKVAGAAGSGLSRSNHHHACMPLVRACAPGVHADVKETLGGTLSGPDCQPLALSRCHDAGAPEGTREVIVQIKNPVNDDVFGSRYSRVACGICALLREPSHVELAVVDHRGSLHAHIGSQFTDVPVKSVKKPPSAAAPDAVSRSSAATQMPHRVNFRAFTVALLIGHFGLSSNPSCSDIHCRSISTHHSTILPSAMRTISTWLYLIGAPETCRPM